jgi:galactokinase
MTSDHRSAAPLELPTPEFAAHIDRLRQLRKSRDPLFQTLIDSTSPVFVARAPGRLDVMGGIADYSGSLVLQLPTAEAAFVAIQPSLDGEVTIVSIGPDQDSTARVVTISADRWSELLASDYDTIQQELLSTSDTSWAGYIIGPVLTLLRERRIRTATGFRIVVDSQVPEGKGVSSSAAIEVATMRAAAELFGAELAGSELARLCEMAENRVAGAPCGIMDQMTSAVGREDKLLALRCQPAIVEGYVPIPPQLKFWGIDSGIRHAVSASDYTSVRVGAFIGYRMIAAAAGLSANSSPARPGLVRVDDPQWLGYLANITPQEFCHCFERILPTEVSGEDFLKQFGGTTDYVTQVDPTRNYAVLYPTRHPIEENARVHRFRTLLKETITESALCGLGELMYAAHSSYTACGLGSEGTEEIVALVRQAGPERGLYGAKITGGGSGGTVAILGRPAAGAAVQQIAQQYEAATGRTPYIFQGSSPGAYSTPVVQVII